MQKKTCGVLQEAFDDWLGKGLCLLPRRSAPLEAVQEIRHCQGVAGAPSSGPKIDPLFMFQSPKGRCSWYQKTIHGEIP